MSMGGNKRKRANDQQYSSSSNAAGKKGGPKYSGQIFNPKGGWGQGGGKKNYGSSHQEESKHHGSISDEEEEHHLKVRDGDELGNRFTVLKQLGKGTFGKVYRCADAKHSDEVAIKVIRKVDRYKTSAKVEAKILKQLYFMQENFEWQPNVVMYTHFEHAGHYCMVFEPLGKTLLQCVEDNDCHGFPTHMVKEVAWQLMSALDFLHRNRLCHTDLKLENILFVEGPDVHYAVPARKAQINARGEPSVMKSVLLPKDIKIKLIDFGGATYEDMKKSRIINTRQYRSPEVLLELGWTYPSDVWSAACCIAEITSGDLLFSTHDDLEHLYMMERVVESIPAHMRERSPVSSNFFHSSRGDYSSGGGVGGWYKNARASISSSISSSSSSSGSSSSGGSRGGGAPFMPLRSEKLSSSSRDYVHNMRPLRGFSQGRDPDFEDFLFGVLRTDPSERLPAAQSLKHRWFNEIIDS